MKATARPCWMRCASVVRTACRHFDGEIERLIREGVLDLDTGLAYATNPGNLQLELADLAQEPADPLLETTVT